MKRNMVLVFLTVAMMFTLFPLITFADSDIDQYRDCKHCGMDRKAYGYSRMLVEYKDGKTVGTCSLNCVITELGTKGGEVVSFKVADRDTRLLIDAEKAVWVIGGSKKGVMTKVAKWAFAEKASAEAFIKSNGGKLATFDEALKTAEKEQGNKPNDHKAHDHKM